VMRLCLCLVRGRVRSRVSCPDCGGYMRKIQKINKAQWMDEDEDYYRCKECGTTLDRGEYLQKA